MMEDLKNSGFDDDAGSDSGAVNQIDDLLREWHAVNASRARQGRADLMQRLTMSAAESQNDGAERTDTSPVRSIAGTGATAEARGVLARIGIVLANRRVRAAASLGLLVTLLALFIPASESPVYGCPPQIMVPDGGRLEAIDPWGNRIGPCALKHTDVNIEVSGPFSRITLRQNYHNPYPQKIEAVYTFPLSQRSAVDRMTMTIGDRIVEAEMKERQQARQIYESARQAGHVASLLEQERPNIFTQSVANIEPGADVIIEISYVEMLQSKDGLYTFDFPMVVAPRYVPGYAGGGGWPAPVNGRGMALPNELERRFGSILLGPASFQRVDLQIQGDPAAGNAQPISFTTTPRGDAPFIQRIIDAAEPILLPDNAYRMRPEMQKLLHEGPSINFNVRYADGTSEFGQIAGDGLGHIAGRWFYVDPALIERVERQATQPTGGFARDTDQVPDASRITPMPVRPPMRAGHDVSLTMTIDTGGPKITNLKSDLHRITGAEFVNNLGEPPSKVTIALANQREIPNRDFVLHWRLADERIEEAVFAHATGGTPVPPNQREASPSDHGYFTVIVSPPARIDDAQVVPRELIFVLDTSGSMSGLPIEKAKAVMSKAIDAMRPGDTFNIITFSGDTHILWDSPRPSTEQNRAEAQQFLAARAGGGGTEMMQAIHAALRPTLQLMNAGMSLEELANLPADGRDVVVAISYGGEPELGPNGLVERVVPGRTDLSVFMTPWPRPQGQGPRCPMGATVSLAGNWSTIDGRRVLQVSTMHWDGAPRALRLVMFMTDGLVGNDEAILQAVRDNARTTRVFSFGVGDAPNRYLLDGIARAGRGEVDYVNLQSDPDATVTRFTRRIATPVLAHIELVFSENLQILDTIPALDALPDLWDVKPLVIHGRYAIVPPALEGGGQGAGEVSGAAKSGTLTIRGMTAAGLYERQMDIALPARSEAHSVVPTLWARARVQELTESDGRAAAQGGVSPDVRQQIIALGEQYRIMTPYTSFVAVEKSRLTIAGRAVLVPIPIELPEGMDWRGVFGEQLQRDRLIREVRAMGIDAALRRVRDLQKVLDYDGALGVVDAILIVDPLNPTAQLLKDVMISAATYRNYTTIRNKELAYSEMAMTPNGQSLVPPFRNISGPGDRSITGSMSYPEDWPGIKLIRDSERGGAAGGGGTGGGDAHGFTGGRELEQRGLSVGGRGQGRVDFPWSRGEATTVDQTLQLGESWYGQAKGKDAVVLGYDSQAIDRRSLAQTNPVPAQFGVPVDSNGDGMPDSNAYFMPPAAMPVGGSADNALESWNVGFMDHDLLEGSSATNSAMALGLIEQSPDSSLQSETHIRGPGRRLRLGPVVPARVDSTLHLNNAPELDLESALQTGAPANPGQGGNGTVEIDDLFEVVGQWGDMDGGGGGYGGGGGIAGAVDVAGDPPSANPDVLAELGGSLLASDASAQIAKESKRDASPQRMAEERDRVITENLGRVRQLAAELKYDEAHQVIDEILFIDPQNAAALLQRDAINIKDERQPDHSYAAKALRERFLLTNIPADFRENPLEQVITYFSQVTGTQIFVDWAELEKIGVTRETPINLQIREAPAETVLLNALELTGGIDRRAVMYYTSQGVVITSPAGKTVPVEVEVAVLNEYQQVFLLAGLVEKGDMERARTVASAVQRLSPTFEPATRMCAVVLNSSLEQLAIRESVAVIEKEVRTELEARIRKAQREARLARILDQRLWPFVFENEGALTPALSQGEREKVDLTIVVLVRDSGDATLAQLKAAGLRVEDTAASTNLVGGTISRESLDDLAMVDAVRRIEPVAE